MNNASYRASLFSHLQEFLGGKTKKYLHTDLQKSSIKKTSRMSRHGPFQRKSFTFCNEWIISNRKVNDFKMTTECMDRCLEKRCIAKSKQLFDALKKLILKHLVN